MISISSNTALDWRFRLMPFAAVLLSLLLHGVVWKNWRIHDDPVTPPIKPPQLLEVEIVTRQSPPPAEPQKPAAAPARPVTPPIAAPVVQPKPPKPVAKPAPKPEAKKEMVKPKPTTRPVPAAEPAPAPKPVAESKAPSPPQQPVAPPRAPPAEAAKPAAKSSDPGTGVTTEASYDRRPTRFPAIARNRGWQGVVKLRVQVLPNGSVGDVRVVQSSGHEMLDESAIEQVKDWSFHPKKKGGAAVASEVTVPISFVLSN